MAATTPTPSRRNAWLGVAFAAALLLAVGLTIVLNESRIKAWLNPPAPAQAQAKAGPIDAGFARSMLLHHAQAIQMSMMMREASSPEIQALAQAIILKQTREMGV
ncbi:MAG TPA: DUF305 domain-containing protein, partial [Limnobacter sp.]|nr:DUF305 domain-containing protein [Limnobacter sp.]